MSLKLSAFPDPDSYRDYRERLLREKKIPEVSNNQVDE